MKEPTRIGNMLIFLQVLVGLSAVSGGVGLMRDGLGMPISFLKGTIFPSFFIPGLILCFIVGGTHLIAAYLVFRKKPYAIEASAVAGFGLMIWLFTEVMIISERNMLQSIFFGLSIIEIILAFLESMFMHHDTLLRNLLTGKRSRL